MGIHSPDFVKTRKDLAAKLAQLAKEAAAADDEPSGESEALPEMGVTVAGRSPEDVIKALDDAKSLITELTRKG